MPTSSSSNENRAGQLLIAAGLALAIIAVMLATAPAAQAGDLPAICDQYPDLPQCEEAVGGGGGGDGDDGVPGAGPTAGGGGPSGAGGEGGELPFTGYPLTPLLWLILLLIAAGLTLRTAVAFRDRIHARQASVPDGG